MDGCGEQTPIPVIVKIDLGPLRQSTFDTGPQSVVGQQSLGHVRYQDRIADVGVSGPNLLHGQVVGQVAGADNLDAVVENEFRGEAVVLSFPTRR